MSKALDMGHSVIALKANVLLNRQILVADLGWNPRSATCKLYCLGPVILSLSIIVRKMELLIPNL